MKIICLDRNRPFKPRTCKEEEEDTRSFNPKLVQIIFKDSVRTSNGTPLFTIEKINLLTLFKEIIAVYFETHKTPVNTECTVTDL
jgi:hypothetical protein